MTSGEPPRTSWIGIDRELSAGSLYITALLITVAKFGCMKQYLHYEFGGKSVL
jgi:hypothetical protein